VRLVNFILSRRDASQAQRSTFDYETRSVTALYERLFPGLDVDGAFKVLVACVDGSATPVPRNLLGVIEVEQQFDFNAYERANDEEKKHRVLTAIHAGSLAAAHHYGWPTEPFERAKDAAIAARLVNRWTWPSQPRWSRNRQHTAVVECSHEPQIFRATMVIRDAEGLEVLRETAFEVLPSDFLFAPKLGNLKWASNSLAVLIDKTGNAVHRGALTEKQ
jgi:hypothetical protein